MSLFDDPFDADARLHAVGCACSTCAGTHVKADVPDNQEGLIDRIVVSSLVREVFGHHDASRRHFIREAGAGALAAALAAVLPVDKVMAAVKDGGGPVEKKDLKVGFIPITCATPIIMAAPMGFYSKYGLNVEAIKTAGWAVIRDKALNKEYDAAHMLSPMPLAISLGVGSAAQPYYMPAVENINGQAITLAMKHKDKRDPKQWKGMKFAVPFDYSMHNFLLRYYLAEAGLDPDKDIQIRAVPPPEMVANLRADNIDGFLGPDPFNQRAVYEGVGFIHLLTKDLWDGHPCCAFAASEEFAKTLPNTFAALFKAIVDATHYASKAEHRAAIAKAIAPRNYLNQPEEVVAAVLTGQFDDGLGNKKSVPNRIDFNPFPWHSMGIWILTQMKRWGYIKSDVDYKKIAEQVYRAADCGRLMKELGYTPPASTYAKYTIMGKAFDPAQPEAYVKSFKISRA
ncbi:MAG: hypothetical protein AMXMBFR6_26380 [Betaproteobacteria bacterium]